MREKSSGAALASVSESSPRAALKRLGSPSAPTAPAPGASTGPSRVSAHTPRRFAPIAAKTPRSAWLTRRPPGSDAGPAASRPGALRTLFEVSEQLAFDPEEESGVFVAHARRRGPGGLEA